MKLESITFPEDREELISGSDLMPGDLATAYSLGSSFHGHLYLKLPSSVSSDLINLTKGGESFLHQSYKFKRLPKGTKVTLVAGEKE